MKTLTVAFIGHRQIKNPKDLMQKIKEVVTALIEEENAETFLFGSKSVFDDLCHIALTELKEKFYPLIKRVYVRAINEKIDDDYKEYLLSLYEETFFPYGVKNAGYRSYVIRNRIMIDMCDVVVTFCDKNYQLIGRTSGTRVAIEYALTKNKRIINLFES